MIRSIIAVLAGVVVGAILILIVEGAGHLMIPPPPGFDLANPDSVKSVPVAAKVAVLAAWFVGSFGGGAAASIIARRWAPAAWVVAATIFLLSAVTMAEIPHPGWMMAGAIAVIALGGFLAVKATNGNYGRPPPARAS